MCVKDKRCHVWVSLESVGIPIQGCLRDPGWLRDRSVVPCDHSIFNTSVYIDLPTLKLTCLKTVSHGKFGYIDLALYETKTERKEVYVKRPIMAGKSLLVEACIQKCVGEYLPLAGFPMGAPQVTRIFRLHDGSICFAMEPIEGAVTMDHYLDTLTPQMAQHTIVSCLFEMCSMMWHLSTMVGINHRDLKPSNFLIVKHDQPIRKIITIQNDILEIETSYSLTLIDFGFSCVGTLDGHHSVISLSTIYRKQDPCPKDGRDLYLFLGLLYIDYYHLLTADLRKLFEQWLEVPGNNLCQFMRKHRDKKETKEWLYFIAGDENIKEYRSCPVRIIRDLHHIQL
jgi:serine/threonine protein kinase